MKTIPRLEQLEDRLAPATLVDPFTITYLDPDGDVVQIQISEPLFESEELGDQVCRFDVGSVDGNNGVAQQLQELDLGPLNYEFFDVSVTVLQATGNGRADVGFLNAADRDLRDVVIAGDLGRIVAGNPNVFFETDFQSLTVRTLGKRGLATQAPGGSMESVITGSLTRLDVQKSVQDARFEVSGVLGRTHIGGDVVRSSIQARIIERAVVDGSLVGAGATPTTIVALGGVQEQERTEFQIVRRQIVEEIPVPRRILNQLGGSLDGLSTAELEALLAKITRNASAVNSPANTDVVYIHVVREITESVPVVTRILVHAPAIEKLLIRGDVVQSEILGLGDGDLGKIQIQGDFSASHIVAGVDPSFDGEYGTPDDRAARFGGVLDELVIGGRILGTAQQGDLFAIVAAEIRSARVSRKVLALLSGPGNDQMTLGSTRDVRLLEAQRTANGGGGP